jgi:hypothetical protein
MVATAAAIDDRPSAFRYPRGEGLGVAIPEIPEPLEIGRGRIVREGSAVAILSFGARLGESLKAADLLAARGVSATVADARFAKPLDEDLILRLPADDLQSHQARSPTQAPTLAAGLEAKGRVFEGPRPGTQRRMTLSDDTLAPWAGSGVVLEYDPARWPRRDQGCVIETADGRILVRTYDGADAVSLFVRGAEGVAETIGRDVVRSVSAVTARLER